VSFVGDCRGSVGVLAMAAMAMVMAEAVGSVGDGKEISWLSG